MRVLSDELHEHVGKRITVAGWVHNERDLGSIAFLLVRDRTGLAQVVLDKPATLAPETVVEIDGEVVPSPQAPAGVELRFPTIRVLAAAASPLPLDLRRPRLKETLPVILNHAPVALRHPTRRATFEIAAAALRGFRGALERLGFTEITTPKLVAAATEGGADVFVVDYFGRPAYLAQSPQLYKQIMVGVHERVFETGPVFRAEPHDTSRHLAQYTSLDAELAFVVDHFDVMAVVRAVVAEMVETIGNEAATAVGLLDVRLPRVPDEIPWVHFADTGVDDVDLAPEDERRLCAEHGDLAFVTGFPLVKRPFYTHPEPRRPAFSNSFDLLFRGLEIVTGGQRLHRYDDYVAALGGETEAFDGYLEAFRYGMPPHGGFALGLERFVAQLVGARNVRETTLFPRDRTRLAP